MDAFYRGLVSAVKRFSNDEQGNDAAEYGLIFCLISLLIVGGTIMVGDSLQTLFNTDAAQFRAAAG